MKRRRWLPWLIVGLCLLAAGVAVLFYPVGGSVGGGLVTLHFSCSTAGRYLVGEPGMSRLERDAIRLACGPTLKDLAIAGAVLAGVGVVLVIVALVVASAGTTPTPAPAVAPPPPGWYRAWDHPTLERWWDGHRWTGHQRPAPPAPPPTGAPR